MPSTNLLRKLAAEAVGTFALVFVGCGAIMVDQQTGALGHAGVCAAFGLVIMVMISATGHVSGAHFNPAVSVAFASIRKFPWREVPGYALAQCCASIAAALTLNMVFAATTPTVTTLGETTTTLAWPTALGVEIVLTFFLMFVITAVATDARAEGGMAGVAIGGSVAMAALMGGPLTGASMNPARSLGPALIGGDLSLMGLYVIGPMIGALLGACTYQWIQRCDDAPATEAGGCC